ncbi:MAG: cupin [Bacilli bacterium]
MKIFRFDKEVGKNIPAFNSSNFIMTRIGHFTDEAHIGCMHIGEEGVVGYHQAKMSQLFLVAQGEGWVRTDESDRMTIKAGEAAHWTEGEWHESGSDEGMVVIVIESPSLNPSTFMVEKVN